MAASWLRWPLSDSGAHAARRYTAQVVTRAEVQAKLGASAGCLAGASLKAVGWALSRRKYVVTLGEPAFWGAVDFAWAGRWASRGTLPRGNAPRGAQPACPRTPGGRYLHSDTSGPAPGGPTPADTSCAPSAKAADPVAVHHTNLSTHATPLFFNTLYDPYREGADFVRGTCCHGGGGGSGGA